MPIDINHDGHDPTDLVTLGTTARGTPIRVHRCVLETDLVIATGIVLPHYFAGFSAGAKAIFPGLGCAKAIRINHALKVDPASVSGRVDDNPVRLDLEELVNAIPTPKFLINAVVAGDHQIRASRATTWSRPIGERSRSPARSSRCARSRRRS